MIVGFSIRGFKSLVNFSLDAPQGLNAFTCLVGLNGAGKSSVLQVLDFTSHVMRGDIDAWLLKRGWSVSDLHSKLTSGSNIIVGVSVRFADGKLGSWVASFNRVNLNCTYERVLVGTEDIFSLNRGKYSSGSGETIKVEFNYTGSILSALKDEVLGPRIIEIRELISNIRSLELLSPHLMRYSPRDAASDIGTGGEKLAPFLYGIKGADRKKLVDLLRCFYPAVVDFKVKQERAGWKKLLIVEEFNGQQVETESKHVNDGLLRILAILAQSSFGKSMLLFDEIENGINPEVVEQLVQVLQNTGQQVLVTTHSPMILNYLSDEVAKASVHLVYRSFNGGTRSRLLFSSPRMAEKLKIMGPGEAFVDTSLTEISSEFSLYDEAEFENAKVSSGSK
ncbi:AAA family ATPase [Pseudomonas syringae]|uniref:AAA family ATPase n=1 Tax=Pseudomonas syringae TaxID=317 RepID=UPI0007EE8A99|nr:AAA family ATPase [Pseudomonas syringae]OBS34035.1 chromosome segregation protein SMC [Pseudomonas syringae pv. syringae]